MQTEEQEKKIDSAKLLAAVAEVLGGWFGFLGIGWLIVGVAGESRQKVTNGILFMIIWWIVLGSLGAFSAGTAGLGTFCLGPVWLIVPLISMNSLMKKCKGETNAD